MKSSDIPLRLSRKKCSRNIVIFVLQMGEVKIKKLQFSEQRWENKERSESGDRQITVVLPRSTLDCYNVFKNNFICLP